MRLKITEIQDPRLDIGPLNRCALQLAKMERCAVKKLF